MSLLRFIFSKQFAIQILLILAVIFMGFLGIKSWLSNTTNHNQKIQVPDLSKLSIEEVATKLEALNLRYEVIDSASYNPNFPKKSVISHAPEKFSYVKENRKIYLTLNPSKYGKVQVQDFYGKTKQEVFAQLKSSGFKIGEILFIPDLGKDVVRELRFKGKKIKSGIMLDKYSEIDVVLGNGKGK